MSGCHDQMCIEEFSSRSGPVIIIYGLEEAEGLCKGPVNILSLQDLSTLCISQCRRLKQIFSSDLARVLLQLKKLYISNCDELEQIIIEDEEEDHIQTPFFSNLGTIDVKRCNKLKHLFPATIGAGLQQLYSIHVQGCDQLQNIFGHKNGADDINDKEIVLPQLKRLSFKALPNLTNFGPVGFHFTMLKSLEMEGCRDQMWKIYFGDWEDFSVDSFKVSEAYYKQEHVSVSFQLENGGCEYRIKSGVKESDLRFVGDGVGLDLCRGLTLTFTLLNLPYLTIDECHKMRHIFSSNLARNLLQLKILKISNCEELEQIIVEDDEDNHIRTPFFPNLKTIKISGCNKLKHVFPISMVQKLEWIVVKECDELEEVFVDGDDVIDDKQNLPSTLQFLELEKLRRLNNFCSTGYHCLFPSLSKLIVKKCGNMATRFSKGKGEDGIVHAEGKPPNDDQPSIDIFYYGSSGNLPPYMEKK